MMRSSIFGWIVAGTGVLLLIPLIAMQFSAEVDWSPGDFAIMGIMVVAFASIFVVIARKAPTRRRAVIGMLLLVVFLWLWAELAVGLFTGRGH